VKRARPVRRAGRRTAFTLVELVTAASLMTVIMLGVVQVFGIVMQTASDAEGIHFAQQQLRALLNRLHNDLRGMTREGYLQIRRGSTQPTGASYTFNPSPGNPMPASAYACDTLAFVTIGQCASAFHGNADANTAEVVYTNNVKTPENPLHVDGRPVDARRGILARGEWIIAGNSSLAGNATDGDDISAATFLYDMFRNQQNFGSDDRISMSGGHVVVHPWIATENLPPDQWRTLKRVMASCVSEFHVEVFDPNADTTGTLTGYFNTPENQYRYTWSWRPNANDTITTWPRAIRVTVAVHDPADTDLPQTDRTGAVKRFRGFALQEVFWLTDP